MRFNASLLCLASLLAVVPLGCSKGADGPPRLELMGTVTHNGQPVKEGEIAFYPEKDSSGLPTSTVIRDGQYKISGRFGIAPGTYRVEIRSFRPDADAPDPEGIERPANSAFVVREQLLPEKFNTKSEIEKLTVTGDENPIVKDFALVD